MRARREDRAEKNGGSLVGGGDSGRKPLANETVKGASFAKSLSSVGMLVSKGNVAGVAREPIVMLNLVTGWLQDCCCQENVFRNGCV